MLDPDVSLIQKCHSSSCKVFNIAVWW